MTQCQIVLNHLKKRGSLTTLQAFRLYLISRLPDRVRDCRAKGYTIFAEMVRLRSGKRVARYSL